MLNPSFLKERIRESSVPVRSVLSRDLPHSINPPDGLLEPVRSLTVDVLRSSKTKEKHFKDLKLSDYRGKYVVFFFYPLDFTFVCPTEIIAFSDAADDFRKIGCEVIAASVDSHFSHFAWTNTPRKQGGLGTMKIPLVSDTRRTISTDYGVLKEDEGIAYRGLFIIDDKGVLRQITINDLPVGRSVEETLRLVQAFQFTDKHGEVCPAGWKPGSDTIKPDVQKSKDFFSKHGVLEPDNIYTYQV
ncbi:hypothetical protein OJAV_G00171620 [Oryzias javanicus]|uniref:thioredoxin-dependent peroxiredoxin n=1 Tax=Oryzias javanicus TaxID=123683 RepID=A0A437CFA9_ORYJA|nr:hypothetical protein OJAV_G00171620 [Oryzias javanicus]